MCPRSVQQDGGAMRTSSVRLNGGAPYTSVNNAYELPPTPLCDVITWQNLITGEWESDIKIVQGSPQIGELAAVVRVFKLFQQPLNLITDSSYVANVVKRLEGSLLRETNNEIVYSYLSCMKTLLENRTHKYFITHIRAHSFLPGLLAEGNAQADKLTMSVLQTVPDIFEQAKLSHAFFPQNAQELMESFCISKSQAKEIIQACPDCQLVQPPASMGAVNPRGLQSLQLWQTDVTNIHLLESSRTFMFQLTLSQEQSLHHYRQGKPHSMPVDIFCKPLYY